MQKKKAGKSNGAKSVKNIPAKALNAKAARAVKGGVSLQGGATLKADEAPKERVGLEYGGRLLKQ